MESVGNWRAQRSSFESQRLVEARYTTPNTNLLDHPDYNRTTDLGMSWLVFSIELHNL
jgi:hypothetical protein